MRWASVIAVVIFLGCLGISATSVAEPYRISQKIGAYQYTVEYTPQPDGSVVAKPTHIWTTQGWWPLETYNLPLDISTASADVVNLGGKQYSVQFTKSSDGKITGDVYAVRKNEDWVYLQNHEDPRKPADKKSPEPPRPLLQSPTETSREAVAIVRIPAPLVQIHSKVITHETTPTPILGHMTNPDVTITTEVVPETSSNTIAMKLYAHVEGSSTASGGRPIAGAPTYSTIGGNLTAPIVISQDGKATAGAVQGPIDIHTAISAWGPLGGRFASRRAARETGQAEGISKQRIRGNIDRAIQSASAKGNQAVDELVRKASGIFPDGDRVELSSRANEGNKPGYVALTITAKKGAEPRKAPPVVDDRGGFETVVIVHESEINRELDALLNDKKYNVGQAMRDICGNKYLKRLPFCSQKMDELAAKTDLHFAKAADHPFAISFKDGTIRITLNATHSVNGIEGSPTKIEMAYQITPQGLVRNDHDIHIVKNAETAVAAQGKSQGGTHADAGPYSIASLISHGVTSIGTGARDLIEGTELLSAYSKAFPRKARLKTFRRSQPGITLKTRKGLTSFRQPVPSSAKSTTSKPKTDGSR